jgi:hypothetical protein
MDDKAFEAAVLANLGTLMKYGNQVEVHVVREATRVTIEAYQRSIRARDEKVLETPTFLRRPASA